MRLLEVLFNQGTIHVEANPVERAIYNVVSRTFARGVASMESNLS